MTYDWRRNREFFDQQNTIQNQCSHAWTEVVGPAFSATDQIQVENMELNLCMILSVHQIRKQIKKKLPKYLKVFVSK